MHVEHVARVAHETNRAYCATISDNSQVSWEDAPEWQKQSARSGALFHLGVLNRGETPDPQKAHEKWMQDKIADGWIYGPEKNPALKQHPSLLPYGQLSIQERMKDYLFIAVCKAFHEADSLGRPADPH